MRQRTGAVISLAAALILAACSDDPSDAPDPSAEATSSGTDAAESTEGSEPADSAETTEPAETAESTAPATTEAATTTTLDAPALIAQIGADYQASYQRREDLLAAPTLDGLPDRLATIAAPGSLNYALLDTFVNDLVATGERIVPNNPDWSTATAQKVELTEPAPYTQALVTGCLVNNQLRVDAAGNRVEGGPLTATQQVEVVTLTQNGWLPADVLGDAVITSGATECPPV